MTTYTNNRFSSTTVFGPFRNENSTSILPSLGKPASAFFQGDVSLNSRLYVVGDVSLNNNLFSSGNVSLGTALNPNTINITNDDITIATASLANYDALFDPIYRLKIISNTDIEGTLKTANLNVNGTMDVIGGTATISDLIVTGNFKSSQFRSDTTGFQFNDYKPTPNNGQGGFRVVDVNDTPYVNFNAKETSTLTTPLIKLNGGLSIHSYDKRNVTMTLNTTNDPPFKVYTDGELGLTDSITCKVPLNTKNIISTGNLTCVNIIPSGNVTVTGNIFCAKNIATTSSGNITCDGVLLVKAITASSTIQTTQSLVIKNGSATNFFADNGGNLTLNGFISCIDVIPNGNVEASSFISNTNGFQFNDNKPSPNNGDGGFRVADVTGVSYVEFNAKYSSTITTPYLDLNGGLTVNSYNRSNYPIISPNSIPKPFQVYTDNNTGINDKVVCNVPLNVIDVVASGNISCVDVSCGNVSCGNVLISKGIKPNYTVFPTLTNANIGYLYLTNTFGVQDFVLATLKNFAQTPILPMGVWLINYQFQLISTGTTSITSVTYDISKLSTSFNTNGEVMTYRDNTLTHNMTTTSTLTYTGQRVVNITPTEGEIYYLNATITYTGTGVVQCKSNTSSFIQALRIA